MPVESAVNPRDDTCVGVTKKQKQKKRRRIDISKDRERRKERLQKLSFIFFYYISHVTHIISLVLHNTEKILWQKSRENYVSFRDVFPQMFFLSYTGKGREITKRDSKSHDLPDAHAYSSNQKNSKKRTTFSISW